MFNIAICFYYYQELISLFAVFEFIQMNNSLKLRRIVRRYMETNLQSQP